MKDPNTFLRYASPNEKRCFSREFLNIYHRVVVGATYAVPESFDRSAKPSYHAALIQCIEQNPFLGALIRDEQTELGYYERAAQIVLDDHIVLVVDDNDSVDEPDRIHSLVASLLDLPFPFKTRNTPRWRIDVLPLSGSRVFVAFNYSHALFDGGSGLAFHRTLLTALNVESISPSTVPSTLPPPRSSLPEPFDTPQRLPISWTYLLRPLLGVHLPTSIAAPLGIAASTSVPGRDTWTGATIPLKPTRSSTAMSTFELPSATVASLLTASRAHHAKLTGTITHLLARALESALLSHAALRPAHTSLVVLSAVNMRSASAVPASEPGNWATGHHEPLALPLHRPALDPALDAAHFWSAAASTTRSLAAAAASLADTPVALLRHVSAIRDWTLKKFGTGRDNSFEVSNIGEFDGGTGAVRVEKVLFAQPGHVVGSPVYFNVVSVRGGPLVVAATWFRGAILGEGRSGEEEGLLRMVWDEVLVEVERVLS